MKEEEEEEEEIKRDSKSSQRMIFFCRLRRPSPNCREHKRLPVSDPLSIQDQGVIGSNYCKFLCMLSTEREGGKGREESSGTSRLPHPALLSGSSLHSEISFKPMKTFPSTAALQLSRAHPTTFSSIPGLPSADLTRSPVGLNRTSVQGHHGWVRGAEREFGALGAPFAQCRNGGSRGGM